jgi:hypothetical protein
VDLAPVRACNKLQCRCKFLLQARRQSDIMLIVIMAIMSTCTLRPLPLAILTCASLAASASVFAGDLQSASVLKVERPVALTVAAQHPSSNGGIALETGKTTIVVSLSSTETMSALSFLNNGAKGVVTVFASPVNLPSSSKRWQQVATSSLVDGAVKSLVRPNEARYLKLSFDVTQPGEVSRFGVQTAATVASKHAKDYALLAADSGAVESDGKAVVDGKDLGDGKDIPSEGEAPAEGPPPGLPAPPPFTFVPVLVPTSP